MHWEFWAVSLALAFGEEGNSAEPSSVHVSFVVWKALAK